ncbi:4-coumarate-CoA ligase [Trichodelitschia bisporula]|uniref:4-coumarate-CoA ligase n=1 Tax=Trichodelitschia bisporula TaxID=703511 RepID=A0A6G1I9J2_9PEZI|nr:4-coumarate-CoA ligase [Trichodelitschia bisporula]
MSAAGSIPPAQKPTPSTQLSVLHGPSYPPLITLTTAGLLDLQCRKYGDKECVVIPWTGARWTYNHLRAQSIALAKMLLDVGIRPGDRIGVFAGNCEQYVALVFAAGRIGAILVVLNNTYTAPEAIHALRHTDCRILFTTLNIGRLDNRPLLARLHEDPQCTPWLDEIVILYGEAQDFRTYAEAVALGASLPLDDQLTELHTSQQAYAIAMLLFTSGSTGIPKASSLTHHNVVNNARFIGNRMRLTSNDVLCCPPPLFHCFGLVLGLLAATTHAATTVYPAEVFDAPATLRAIHTERCTVLHGVPAMFDALFSTPRTGLDLKHLRTGIIAGSPVPRHLMEQMVAEFGMTEFTSSYGLTEASPTCFNAHVTDTVERKLHTVGTLLPHAHAKIVDREGNIVPIGTRGELCIAGYQLHAGYWRNAAKTAENMSRDDDGVLWLHTGDEAVFDAEGYASITGRFKELIIRGGENIYPLEIEERLVRHPAIERAVVVGVKHARLVEVVAAFLVCAPGERKMSFKEVREWCGQTLGRHKCPEHVFWFGELGVPAQVPLTGSGKIQKFVLRDVAERILAGGKSARL